MVLEAGMVYGRKYTNCHQAPVREGTESVNISFLSQLAKPVDRVENCPACKIVLVKKGAAGCLL